MTKHSELSDTELLQKIKRNEILFGGNLKMKIYGTLACKPGKRLKKENRVFFIDSTEAKALGFRPCGNCMRAEYKIWKNGLI